MGGRGDRAAVALVLLAAGAGAAGLGLELLGHGSTAASLGVPAIGVAAGGGCLFAWARGARSDPRRLPLLLVGMVLPAFAAFVLAPAADHGPWEIALEGAGVSAVAVAVLVLYRRRP
jgi:hypothetical protein